MNNFIKQAARDLRSAGSGLICGYVIVGILNGCGGQAEDWTQLAEPRGPYIEGSVLITPDADPGDIASHAEALIVPQAGSVNQVGFMLDGTMRACVTNFSAQNCWVQHGASDGKKRLRYYITGASSAGKGRIRAALQDWALSMFQHPNPALRLWDIPGHGNDGWDVSEASGPSDPLTTVVFRAENDAAGVCGGSVGNISRYVCWSSELTRGLTEHGLNGNYHTSVDIPVAHVDDAEIQAGSGTTVTKNRLTRQAVWALADMFGGHGLVASTAPACTSTTTVTSQLCVNPDSQACLMNNAGDNGNQDDLTQLAPNCGF